MRLGKLIEINWPKYFAFLIKRKFYYAVRNSWPIWFYVVNREGRSAFESNKPRLNDIQKKIVEDWNKNGIAMTSLSELFGDEADLNHLQEYARKIDESSLKVDKNKKTFLRFLFTLRPVMDFENPFATLALNRKVLDIVNSYMGLNSTFRTMSLNITMPVGEAAPKDSQMWHRDPEDKVVCKMFLYLSDVDEDSGPFIYATKTHHKGIFRRLFPTQPPAGSYPPEAVVKKSISSEYLKVNTGKAGTIIFCETTGLHKGGYAKSKERIMFTSMYSSKKSMHSESFDISENLKDNLSKLDDVQRFALQA